MNEACYYSPSQLVVIDLIGANGLSVYAQETEDQLRQRYPDAQRMTLDDAVLAKENALISAPVEITEAQFINALEVLPPNQWRNLGVEESFKMCEHLSGAITTIYARLGTRYFSFNDRFNMPHTQIIAKCKATMLMEVGGLLKQPREGGGDD